MGQSNNQLAHLMKAKREPALVTRIDEVKEIRSKAEALRVYAKQAGESLEMQNNCAEIKIRAERRAGELLKESGRKKGETDKKIMFHDGTLSPTLKKLGIERKQSMRWQIIADIPERIFEQHVQETMARAKTGDARAELTTVGVLKLAKRHLASTEFRPILCPSFSQFAWPAVSARCPDRPIGRSGV